MWLGDDAMWTGHDLPAGDLPADGLDGSGEHLGEPAEWTGGGAAGAGHEPLPFDTITAMDMDGDGVLETMIVHDGEETIVSYDLDGDGATDFETVFDGHGHAVSWQDQQDADGTWHWRRVSE